MPPRPPALAAFRGSLAGMLLASVNVASGLEIVLMGIAGGGWRSSVGTAVAQGAAAGALAANSGRVPSSSRTAGPQRANPW